MKKLYITLLIAISVVLTSSGLYAQIPLGEEFSYQGELNDANGNPHDGVFDFKFVAFDAKDDGMGTNLGQFVAEDVTVTNGIFTTQIDYSILGDQPFVGNKVWLEISVRIGTTTGGYQQLLPRQQVTATPYANYATIAEMVGSNAVGTNEIIDDSIAAVDIDANAVGTSEIDSTQVQRRVTTTCPSGEFIQSVNQDGTAVCVAETGGITSVTSADIVDGTIGAIDIDNTEIQQRIGTVCSGGRSVRSVNTSGVAACIFPTPNDNSVNSAKVADGSIVAVDVDTSQIQQRVSSSCDDGFYLNGINQDGSIQCKKLPISLPFTLDNSANVGSFTSIAIGVDNNPVISYYDITNGDLKAYKCSNSSCSAGTAYTLDGNALFNPTSVGGFTSIAIGTDNNPVISYYDFTNDNLKFYKCNDTSCSSGSASTLNGFQLGGSHTSIAVGSDNNPIISFNDDINGRLVVYKCNDIACQNGTVFTLYDTNSVSFSSLTIGSDNNPIIAYARGNGEDLYVYRCFNTSCSAGSSNLIDGSGSGYTGSFNGRTGSIAIGADNNPIIIYSDDQNQNIKVFKCNSISCNSGPSFIAGTGYSIDAAGVRLSIAIGADNNPIISYYDTINDSLKVFSCGNPSCSN